MQPHSMCAVAMANLIWNQEMTNLEFCRLRVSYTNRSGEVKNNYYDISGIELSGKNKFNVTIKRSGGGLACTMDVERNSESSNDIEMTHRTQHIAGLKEKYKLRKDEIKDGEHKNSMKYSDFRGLIKYKEELELKCKVLTLKTHQWIELTYNLSVDSKRLKKS